MLFWNIMGTLGTCLAGWQGFSTWCFWLTFLPLLCYIISHPMYCGKGCLLCISDLPQIPIWGNKAHRFCVDVEILMLMLQAIYGFNPPLNILMCWRVYNGLHISTYIYIHIYIYIYIYIYLKLLSCVLDIFLNITLCHFSFSWSSHVCKADSWELLAGQAWSSL